MQLNESLAFVSVVDAGSFTAAGRRLGVPKSTLSRQVSRLEDHLGARLLQRTTRKLSLTETGQAYYARCRDAIDALAEAERVAQDLSSVARGVVKVSASFDLVRDHVAPLLPVFAERYPEVDLNLVMSQERVDLVAEGFDLALRGGILDDSGFISRKLAESEVWLCATPAYLDAHAPIETVADLADHDAIAMTRRGEEIPWRMQGPGGMERLPLRPRLRANEWGALRAAILADMGVGMLLSNGTARLIEEGKVRRVLPDYALRGGGLYAVYPSRHHLSPKVRVLVDFLADHLRDAG